MQLYIADMLQEYEGQPAVVYKAVSNLLVGFNTELRLLYDKYRWVCQAAAVVVEGRGVASGRVLSITSRTIQEQCRPRQYCMLQRHASL
jgi:hypothetical protein